MLTYMYVDPEDSSLSDSNGEVIYERSECEYIELLGH